MGDATVRHRIEVLGVGLDPVGRGEVERWTDAALVETAPAGCRHVVTLNPEYVMAARRDIGFGRAIAAADLVVADGIGVLLAAKLLDRGGASGARRVTGLDLCDLLAEACARSGRPLFLLGGRGGAASGAAVALGERFAGLPPVSFWEGGGPGPTDDAAALARIKQCGANVVLVAYGAPAQVVWIDRNRASMAEAGVRIAVGVGGAFDFLSGRVSRAPRLVRSAGLEWLYRLGREPWRWRRQLALPRFAVLVLAAVARTTGRRAMGPIGAASRPRRRDK